jgi:alpha-beta hydrolase superfamily lysophospholipase
MERISISGGAGKLGGVWTAPAGEAPRAAVVMVPGSGPTDLDGDNPLGVRAATYRLLAQALAQHGIATLRIDKRGLFSSTSALADPDAVTLADYAQDALAWVGEASRRSGLPRVFLLGHSEGGLVVLEAALRAPEAVAGLILAAAPGRRLGDVLREQLIANPANAPLLGQALDALDRLERGDGVEAATLHPALAPLFRPSAQGYLADLMARDPAAMLARTSMPALVLHGTHDLQVSDLDAEKLASARTGVELRMLEGVNHVLKAAPADRAGNFEVYGRADLPIDPQAVEAIAVFVAANA